MNETPLLWKRWLLAVALLFLPAGLLPAAPPQLPEGPLVAKSLRTGQRCEQSIQYTSIPPATVQQSALATARSFLQSGTLTEVTTRQGNGAKSVAYLTDKLILESGEGIGVESLARAEPSTIEQFDCFGVVRWVSPENFTGIETRNEKTYWKFSQTHPLYGQQTALIEAATRQPSRYSDTGRNIVFSYASDSRSITLPPELESAQQRFLSVHPDGVSPTRN